VALPGGVAEAVRRALEERGLGGRIERVSAVAGGCINNGARLDTDRGASFFLKWNAAAPAAMFAAEADGLRALAARGALRVPVPITWSGDSEGDPETSWLLMEYVLPGRASARARERLGAGLAAIHAADAPLFQGAAGPAFGWHRDNWIGSLPQANGPSSSWGDFWREQRLGPQLERARAGGYLADPALDRVLELTAEALADVVRPELLHGDLWGGNWFATTADEPVLIDPAVYLGHGEVDLAMSQLFGGFGPRFYDAYRGVRGIADAYEAYRRDLYQLYYLLVHVNLFGGSYEAGSLVAARRVVSALSG
jgi:protein-ribulosamine 3-kinase